MEFYPPPRSEAPSRQPSLILFSLGGNTRAMTPDQIAKSVCEIPAEFRRRQHVSLRDLVVASGYTRSDESLRVAIEQRVRARPQLVDEWIAYSADKRSSGGWFFEDGAPAVVGYQDSHIGRSREEHFRDRSLACTEFIIRELESMCERTA